MNFQARQDGLADRPLEILAPSRQDAPVVFSSPHSGNRYPDHFVASSRLDPVALRRSEDCYVDELFANAPTFGAPLLRALFPRAYVDVNREQYELDPEMFREPLPPFVTTRSPRISAGLGTLARVVANGAEIYGSSKLSFADAESRILSCYRPYHHALSKLVQETRARFGVCLLIDCHSMPSIQGMSPRMDVVLGDCYGSSCLSAISEVAERSLTANGLAVGRNAPYAGGYITRSYGRPCDGIHALQIEISRDLYMNEQDLSRSANFMAIRDAMTDLAKALAECGRNMIRAAA
jgi:N-formylglutamate amidohydrolase